MQVTFGDHPYLFVNPQLQGRQFQPVDGTTQRHRYNYGGDKLWPLPEGEQDEQHWPGLVSDELDAGIYEFKILSRSAECKVLLEGPPEPRTGLQYSREISLRSAT